MHLHSFYWNADKNSIEYGFWSIWGVCMSINCACETIIEGVILFKIYAVELAKNESWTCYYIMDSNLEIIKKIFYFFVIFYLKKIIQLYCMFIYRIMYNYIIF